MVQLKYVPLSEIQFQYGAQVAAWYAFWPLDRATVVDITKLCLRPERLLCVLAVNTSVATGEQQFGI